MKGSKSRKKFAKHLYTCDYLLYNEINNPQYPTSLISSMVEDNLVTIEDGEVRLTLLGEEYAKQC